MPAIEAAYRCGFADQSHLANEFRRVAGGPARQIQLAEVAFLEPPAGG
jgi:AraC-like DNA-binding protein